MKKQFHRIFILALLMLSACNQQPKQTETAHEAATTTALEKNKNPKTLKRLISKLPTKALPLVDSINLANFSFNKWLTEEELKSLSFNDFYPGFFEEPNSLQVAPAYQLKPSNAFRSIVFSIVTPEEKLVNLIVNYDFDGNVLGFAQLAYDDNSKHNFREKSRIENNTILTEKSYWFVESKRKTDFTSHEILPDGSIRTNNSKDTWVALAIQSLQLDKSTLDVDLIDMKFNPKYFDEKIVVLPEIANATSHYYELNSHIAILDAETGEMTHSYFESAATNGWIADAVGIESINVEYQLYKIAPNIEAFGIVVDYANDSQLNPYKRSSLSLFIKSGNKLKKVLDNFIVKETGGERDGNCYGETYDKINSISFSPNTTNGFYDLLVENKLVETQLRLDENGDCNEDQNVKLNFSMYTFDGDVYQLTTPNLSTETFNNNKGVSLTHSQLRAEEIIKMGEVHRDTVTFLNFDDNYDYWFYEVQKNEDTIKLILEGMEGDNYSKGDQLVIDWKMDLIQYGGDESLSEVVEFLVGVSLLD